jgi:hypothetical protein
MLLSGREIHTFWPEGIGSPSVGVGSSLPATSSLACGGGVAGPGGVRKNDLLSCSQTVSRTPDVYFPGCVRTASHPASRRTE